MTPTGSKLWSLTSNSLIFWRGWGLGAQKPKSGLGRLNVEVSRYTQLHAHTPGRTSLNQCSARRRGRYLHNTQQTHDTNIHALTETRTRYPSNKAAAELRIKLHDLLLTTLALICLFSCRDEQHTTAQHTVPVEITITKWRYVIPRISYSDLHNC